ncbi:MAG: lipoprotein-releasing ABC transporter permease subunit [Pseudidiomarina maritima]|nr:lipoprotein-releasing ABC transporter permease subunit [Pseudidiomarina maritima]
MRAWQLAWLLARRFRGKRERSGFVSFISASSTLGIALGCMVFITGLSVMNGFEEVLQKRFLSLVPQVEFSAVKGQLKDPQGIIDLALAHPQVASARAVIRSQALIQQGTEFVGVQLEGIATEQPHAIADYMPAATWQQLQQQPRGVVLGSQLAARLGVQTGDKLALMVAQQGSFKQPKRQALTVVGTFTFGGQVDHQYAYVDLTTAQALMGFSEGAQAVELTVTDIFAVQQIATQLGYQIDDYVYLDHWMRSQGHLYRDIQLVRLVMYLVLVLVLAVACFNIVSTLVMTVQEKQRHIGILRTMGLRRGRIMQVFIWQGLQNGVLGVSLGVLAGVVLTSSLPYLLQWFQQLTGDTLLASDVYFVTSIPVQLQGVDIVLVALVALLMSGLATLYPAWQASRTDIVKAISAT